MEPAPTWRSTSLSGLSDRNCGNGITSRIRRDGTSSATNPRTIPSASTSHGRSVLSTIPAARTAVPISSALLGRARNTRNTVVPRRERPTGTIWLNSQSRGNWASCGSHDRTTTSPGDVSRYDPRVCWGAIFTRRRPGIRSGSGIGVGRGTTPPGAGVTAARSPAGLIRSRRERRLGRQAVANSAVTTMAAINGLAERR